MLLQPRVVGRALKRNVEGDLETRLPGLLQQATEVIECPKIGMHGGVAALGGAVGGFGKAALGVTTIRPFIRPWPEPQYSEHLKS